MFYLHSAMSDTSDTASTASLVSTSGTCWFGYTEEPLDLCDLLAQEDTRLLADINDYDDPLWILDCIEYDNDWNEWMVAYFCQLTEKWFVHRAVWWWGHYPDWYYEWTDYLLEDLRMQAAGPPEPTFEVWE